MKARKVHQRETFEPITRREFLDQTARFLKDANDRLLKLEASVEKRRLAPNQKSLDDRLLSLEASMAKWRLTKRKKQHGTPSLDDFLNSYEQLVVSETFIPVHASKVHVKEEEVDAQKLINMRRVAVDESLEVLSAQKPHEEQNQIQQKHADRIESKNDDQIGPIQRDTLVNKLSETKSEDTIVQKSEDQVVQKSEEFEVKFESGKIKNSVSFEVESEIVSENNIIENEKEIESNERQIVSVEPKVREKNYKAHFIHGVHSSKLLNFQENEYSFSFNPSVLSSGSNASLFVFHVSSDSRTNRFEERENDSNLITLHGKQRSRVHGNEQGREELGICAYGMNDSNQIMLKAHQIMLNADHGVCTQIEDQIRRELNIEVQGVADLQAQEPRHFEGVIPTSFHWPKGVIPSTEGVILKTEECLEGVGFNENGVDKFADFVINSILMPIQKHLFENIT